MTGDSRSVRRRREREMRKVAIRAARAQGCTCHVEITFGPVIEGVPMTEAHHDEWCPLLRTMQERPPGPARMQGVLYRPEQS